MNLGIENEKQEFKLGTGQLDKGLKSLSAMLNRGFEGTVYFGVDDDGTVKGINIGKRTLLDIRSRATELIEPRTVLDIDVLQDEEGRSYIRVHAAGSDIPYSCDGRYYLRTAAADEQIGSDLLRRMLVSGDTDILMQISSDNQNLTFKGMVTFLNNLGKHASETKAFLNSFGMFNKEGKYNRIAYLLSDQNEMIVKVMRFKGTDKNDFDQRLTYDNQSLILTVKEILDYFKLINKPKKIDAEAGTRLETPLFDYQSFREAWINACVHTTWTENISPSVYLYDDRIEVVSYGGLPFGLSKEGFYTGTSKPVNNRLFNIFITCGFTEQSGHGIPRIVDHYGREAFSFNDGLLKVTIPYGYVPDYVFARQARNKIIDILTGNQRNVLHYLADNPYSSLQAVADSCSLSLGGVKKIVGKLQEMELLERKGPKNNPQWIVR